MILSPIAIEFVNRCQWIRSSSLSYLSSYVGGCVMLEKTNTAVIETKLFLLCSGTTLLCIYLAVVLTFVKLLLDFCWLLWSRFFVTEFSVAKQRKFYFDWCQTCYEENQVGISFWKKVSWNSFFSQLRSNQTSKSPNTIVQQWKRLLSKGFFFSCRVFIFLQ